MHTEFMSQPSLAPGGGVHWVGCAGTTLQSPLMQVWLVAQSASEEHSLGPDLSWHVRLKLVSQYWLKAQSESAVHP
jgi:hypothetical protein